VCLQKKQFVFGADGIVSRRAPSETGSAATPGDEAPFEKTACAIWHCQSVSSLQGKRCFVENVPSCPKPHCCMLHAARCTLQRGYTTRRHTLLVF